MLLVGVGEYIDVDADAGGSISSTPVGLKAAPGVENSHAPSGLRVAIRMSLPGE